MKRNNELLTMALQVLSRRLDSNFSNIAGLFMGLDRSQIL
jgi:hypothetical protein